MKDASWPWSKGTEPGDLVMNKRDIPIRCDRCRLYMEYGEVTPESLQHQMHSECLAAANEKESRKVS